MQPVEYPALVRKLKVIIVAFLMIASTISSPFLGAGLQGIDQPNPSQVSQSTTTPCSGAGCVIGTIPVGSGPVGVAFASSNNDTYVTDSSDDAVSVINSTNSVIKVLSVGDIGSPYGTAAAITYSNSSKEVYVGNTFSTSPSSLGRSVTPIVTTSYKVATPIHVSLYSIGDRGIAYAWSNQGIYIPVYDSTPGNPVTYISVINSTVDQVVTRVNLDMPGCSPCFSSGVAYSPTTKEVYVTSAYNTTLAEAWVTVISATNHILKRIPVLGRIPTGLAFSPSNQRVYVATENPTTYAGAVIEIDKTDNIFGSPISVGDSPYRLAFATSNKDMYVTNSGDNTVSIIDTSTDSIVTTIPVGHKPAGIAYSSYNKEIYVANLSDNTVSVISTNSARPVLLIHGVESTAAGTWESGDVKSGTKFNFANLLRQQGYTVWLLDYNGIAENCAKVLPAQAGSCPSNAPYILDNNDKIVRIRGWGDDSFRPASWNGRSNGADGPVPLYAKVLADAIIAVLSTTGASQLDIVAHSYGGLVSRCYLQGCSFGGDVWTAPGQVQNKVGKLIMLGTPNHGSPIAETLVNHWKWWYRLGIARLEGGKPVPQGDGGSPPANAIELIPPTSPAGSFLRELNGWLPNSLSFYLPSLISETTAGGVAYYAIYGTDAYTISGGLQPHYELGDWLMGGSSSQMSDPTPAPVSDGLVPCAFSAFEEKILPCSKIGDNLPSVCLDTMTVGTDCVGFSLSHFDLHQNQAVLDQVVKWLQDDPQQASITRSSIGEDPILKASTITGSIHSGQALSKSILITLTNRTNFILAWDAGNNSLSFSLKAPSGATISPTTSGVDYANGSFFAAYSLSAPEQGVWQAVISANQDCNYTLQAILGESTIGMSLVFDKALLSPGDSVTLGTSIVNGTTSVRGLSASALLMKPDGSLQTLQLLDSSNNGTYLSTYSNTTQLGIYPLEITAYGTLGGISFTRSMSSELFVSAAASETFDFSLSAPSPNSVTMSQGGTSTPASIEANTLTGAGSPVTFSASGLPNEVTAIFTNNPCTPTCSANITFSATPAATVGTRTVTITASGGGTSHTTALTLVVTPFLTFANIDFPGAKFTAAFGINNNGQIVGSYSNTTTGCCGGHGYLLSGVGGIFSTFDHSGSQWTIPHAINDTGAIVGSFCPATGCSGLGVTNGFLLIADTSSDVTAPGACTSGGETASSPNGINSNGGLIVGSIEDCSGLQHGWLLSHGTFTAIDYPGADQTAAFGVNNAGQIVGIYWSSQTAYHGWLLSSGTLTAVDVPGAGYTRAQAINSAGDIVGFYSDASGKVHGFLLSKNRFSTIDYPGATSTDAYGINDESQIVGTYIDPSGKTHAYVATYSPGGSTQAPTSTSVTCTPSPVDAGSSSTCTATITGANPTGTVTFTHTGLISAGFSSSSCALSSGFCSVKITGSIGGTGLIIASYSGDSSNAPSTGSASLEVRLLACSTITLSASSLSNCRFLGLPLFYYGITILAALIATLVFRRGRGRRR